MINIQLKFSHRTGLWYWSVNDGPWHGPDKHTRIISMLNKLADENGPQPKHLLTKAGPQ